MRNLVEHILNREYDTANQIFESEIETVTRIKLNEAKKMVAARMAEQVPEFMGAPGSNAVKLRRGVLEEDDPDPGPSSVLRKKRDDAQSAADNAVKPWANLVTDYGHNSNIGKKATSYLSGMQAKAKKAEQDYDDASKAYRKDLDVDRVKNKLSSIAKDSPELRPKIEKLYWQKKADSYGGEYAKRRPSETEPLKEESEELDEARIKILKARVRGGKVQRRRKVSNVEGHKIVDGKLKRMSPAERRRRKLGQKRGKLKRRAKMRQALMKRRRSLKRRAAIGL